MSTSCQLHRKCINAAYSNVERFRLEDNQIPWSVNLPNYHPVVFTDPKILAGPFFADPDISINHSVKLAFNAVDGKVNRVSFMGNYAFSKEGLPLNPVGRTGITGRGLLGRWGPNHAADPIVTRWKRDPAKPNERVIHSTSKKPILQFVSIRRSDTKEWALPGGMVDPGEEVSVTLKREFSEEALNMLEASDADKETILAQVAENFKHGVPIYSGYVDDPRNTDNAWMETVAVNFHDETDTGLGKFTLHAGDDAIGVRWADVDSKADMYASHRDFIHLTAQHHNAHW